MKQIYILSIILFTLNSYSQIGAEILTIKTGTLSEVPFTISDNSTHGTAPYDLSGWGFSDAPLSNSQPIFLIGADSDWSVTFDTPIPNLRLYCYSFRNTTYEFSQAFTILPGSQNLQNPNNNELLTNFPSGGIIEFTDPVTTLNLTVISSPNGSSIGFTFGLDQAQILSLDENEIDTNKLTLYSNPSKDFIKLNGLTKTENYSIYNTLGQEIKKGIVLVDEKIDIQNLTNGMYYLKFDNGNTLKFLKE